MMLEVTPGLGLVTGAGNYGEAVEKLQHDEPDIVLLDINLPDRNGLDLLRHIRRQHPSVVVIMCSNQSSPFYRNICKRIGAACFVDKSAEFEAIPTIVANFL